jgi:stress-induced morphogen
MPAASEIKERIEAALPDAQVEVEDFTGGGDHFRARVLSPTFSGKSRIERHRLIYAIFGDQIGGPIHALSLETIAPGERDQAPVGGQRGSR